MRGIPTEFLIITNEGESISNVRNREIPNTAVEAPLHHVYCMHLLS
jgi:hypothetical protein